MSAPEPSEDARAFARQVLELLRELYPQQPASLGADGETVRLGEAQFGLSNLAAKYREAGGGLPTLRRLVKQHFNLLLGEANTLLGGLSWGEARPILLPQLMPETFLAKLPLAERPFGPGVRVGLVIDAPHGYRYARRDELAAWSVSASQAFAIAEANLTARSRGLPIQVSLARERMLAMTTGDGYDAVRVLLPRWRAVAEEHLGLPFRFGIPNRDFLICWSVRNSAQSQAAFRARIAGDFKTRPYPLSPLAFEMNCEGNVRPVS